MKKLIGVLIGVILLTPIVLAQNPTIKVREVSGFEAFFHNLLRVFAISPSIAKPSDTVTWSKAFTLNCDKSCNDPYVTWSNWYCAYKTPSGVTKKSAYVQACCDCSVLTECEYTLPSDAEDGEWSVIYDGWVDSYFDCSLASGIEHFTVTSSCDCNDYCESGDVWRYDHCNNGVCVHHFIDCPNNDCHVVNGVAECISGVCENLDIRNGRCKSQSTGDWEYCWENEWVLGTLHCPDPSAPNLKYCKEPIASDRTPVCSDVCSNKFCGVIECPGGACAIWEVGQEKCIDGIMHDCRWWTDKYCWVGTGEWCCPRGICSNEELGEKKCINGWEYECVSYFDMYCWSATDKECKSPIEQYPWLLIVIPAAVGYWLPKGKEKKKKSLVVGAVVGFVFYSLYTWYSGLSLVQKWLLGIGIGTGSVASVAIFIYFGGGALIMYFLTRRK